MGFSSLDLDHYFTSGLMPDMPETDPVTTGKASRDDSRFGAALIQPAGQNLNETVTPAPQEAQTQVDAGDDVAYEPPSPPRSQWTINTQPESPGYVIFNGQKMTLLDGKWVVLDEEPIGPGDFNGSLPTDIKLRFDNPFKTRIPGTNDPFAGTPFDLSWRNRASQLDQESIVLIVVDDEVYELRLNGEEMAELAFSLLPPEEQLSLIEQAERKAELAAAEEAYDEALEEWEEVNRQIEEAIAKFNWQSISQDKTESFVNLAAQLGAIDQEFSIGANGDRYKTRGFQFQGTTYIYEQEQIYSPITLDNVTWMNPPAWELRSIVRSTDYSVEFGVKSLAEERLAAGNIGYELFVAIVPGGTTSSTYEEEFYAPGGKRREERVAIAFVADVLETLTLYGKLSRARQSVRVYQALAVAHGANGVYAGADAANRFANGEDGAWGKSLEALLSLVAAKGTSQALLADFKAAAQRLAAASRRFAEVSTPVVMDGARAAALTLRSRRWLSTASSIEAIGYDTLTQALQNFKDARLIRRFLASVEADFQNEYIASYRALLADGVPAAKAAKEIARRVETRMTTIGSRMGLNVKDQEGIRGYISRVDGVKAIHRDGLTTFRVADLTLDQRRIVVELTLEDTRGINHSRTWLRMSGHKIGQLPDYALARAKIFIITPW